MRTEINQLTDKNDMLEQRTKHLQNVITRFGNYDVIEFDFAASANKKGSPGFNFDEEDQDQEEEKKAIDPVQEIEQEYLFNKKMPPTKEQI